MHYIYLAITPIEFNGTLSQANMHKTAAPEMETLYCSNLIMYCANQLVFMMMALAVITPLQIVSTHSMYIPWKYNNTVNQALFVIVTPFVMPQNLSMKKSMKKYEDIGIDPFPGPCHAPVT